MAHGQAQAEAAVRQLIARLDDGRFTYAMDNGAQVAVAVKVDRDARHVTIDFTGSSATLPDNFNDPLPVVRAAVLYEIGRESCRERECQYVSVSVVAVNLQKKNKR